MRIRRVNIAAMLVGGACFGIAVACGGLARAASADAPQSLAESAYAAMGMSDIYRGEGSPARETVVTLTTRGTVQAWDPGESYSVSDLTTPDRGTSTYVQMWDRSRGYLRTQWTRMRAGAPTRTYTEIVLPNGGYVIGNDANGAPTNRAVRNGDQVQHTMSGLRLRALLREQERNAVVFEMHEYPDRVSEYPAQTVNGKTYPAVRFQGDHGTFIVMFDPDSKLPAIVRTRDFDQLMGDADFDQILSDWRDVGTIKFPYHIEYTLNGEKIFDTTVSEYALNGQLPVDAFSIPTALRGKEVQPAPVDQVPFQWVLLRLASGFYLDSDALYTDDGGSLTLTDVGPNMSLVTGSTHNTLIVATNDYLVAFDSPGDDGQSKIAIDLAHQKYPGKQFRYLVLTHHHIDHTGGLRAYVADGATVVVGKGNGDFFRRALSAPTTLNPYRLDGTVEPRVIEVDGKWSVNDGGRTIEAYALDNPHAAGYLIPYVPDAKMGFVTDLWSPGQSLAMPNPNMVAVVRGVEGMGIAPERFAGGHGGVGDYADLVRAVGPAQ